MLNRPRRNRKNDAIRSMIEETVLRPSNLIYPLFLSNTNIEKEPISSLPDVYRLNMDGILKEIEESIEAGIKTFILFPVIPESFKDKTGSYSYQDDNFYLQGIRKIKEHFPGVVLMSDVALDPYSTDGHDGIVRNGEILNDETLPILSKMAVAQAQAGIDIIGPSDMMDGRVRTIREALDVHQYEHVSIMSYTAKYASAFYGPFRDALDSAPKAGDKKTYQMNPANKNEALREAELDEAEGADFLMVKPALAYLDVIHLLKENSYLPIAAYNVSGEYAMLKAACANGWLEYEKAMPEMLLSMKRAGADSILTYFAKDYAQLYKKLL
ncbi:porphobilinogen synthase [Paracrocinitomix mangrovi]|uniref:porphobilinogen synthase n=1 Tax=Paracrocinitomix mangrovi TaxID=2862509 RepID=UPI001C8DC5E3|nr:porphobilinogen synthase [Paracrocinitomix mangrovi]UKN02821.1 porphobilinogen synthase [Paracrocinitomix mangrovi]